MRVRDVHEVVWEPYRLFYSLGDNDMNLVGEFCLEKEPTGYMGLPVAVIGTAEEGGSLYVVCADDEELSDGNPCEIIEVEAENQ